MAWFSKEALAVPRIRHRVESAITYLCFAAVCLIFGVIIAFIGGLGSTVRITLVCVAAAGLILGTVMGLVTLKKARREAAKIKSGKHRKK